MNTDDAKYFNRPFQQETRSMALIKRTLKIKYVIFQCYSNSIIYEISKVSTLLKEFFFFKSYNVCTNMVV